MSKSFNFDKFTHARRRGILRGIRPGEVRVFAYGAISAVTQAIKNRMNNHPGETYSWARDGREVAVRRDT